MAVLVPCLNALRGEFNTLSPNRDKSTDGWIGDTSHGASSSDHNPDETGNTPNEDSDNVDEVHAIDVDKSGPWPAGASFTDLVNEVVNRHKAGKDNRLQNVIWNRKIASKSWGWTWDDYTGSNSHTEHAHFSALYSSAQEADTSSWGLVDKWGDELPMDQGEFNKLMDGWAKTSNGKKYLESASKADNVQRYDADGVAITGSDNDFMGVNSALGYISRDVSLLAADVRSYIDDTAL